MKILYIAPENTVGTLDLWRKIHESHGNEMHAIIKPVIDRAWMSLTSEHDLLNRHPKLDYLFLPYDVTAQDRADLTTEPVTLCHATRSRYIKKDQISLSRPAKVL